MQETLLANSLNTIGTQTRSSASLDMRDYSLKTYLIRAELISTPLSLKTNGVGRRELSRTESLASRTARSSRSPKSRTVDQEHFQNAGSTPISVGLLRSGEVDLYEGASLIDLRPILAAGNHLTVDTLPFRSSTATSSASSPSPSAYLSFALTASAHVEVRQPRQIRQERRGGGPRRPITCFSPKAKRAALKVIAKIRRNALWMAWLLTLTFPANHQISARAAKRKLKRLPKHLKQKWPDLAAIWVLEPTQKGLPHFHAILLGVPYICD